MRYSAEICKISIAAKLAWLLERVNMSSAAAAQGTRLWPRPRPRKSPVEGCGSGGIGGIGGIGGGGGVGSGGGGGSGNGGGRSGSGGADGSSDGENDSGGGGWRRRGGAGSIDAGGDDEAASMMWRAPSQKVRTTTPSQGTCGFKWV
eukprot:3386835-Pleurochrysis_carterae.AAC.1